MNGDLPYMWIQLRLFLKKTIFVEVKLIKIVIYSRLQVANLTNTTKMKMEKCTN